MHAAKALPSSAHSNREAPGALNVNAWDGSRVTSRGPASIVACGAVVSTVKLHVAGVGSAFPASSTVRACAVCAPSPRFGVVQGDAQDVYAPESTRHS